MSENSLQSAVGRISRISLHRKIVEASLVVVMTASLTDAAALAATGRPGDTVPAAPSRVQPPASNNSARRGTEPSDRGVLLAGSSGEPAANVAGTLASAAVAGTLASSAAVVAGTLAASSAAPRRSPAAAAPTRSIYAPALLSSYRRSMEIESDIARACTTYGVPLPLARSVCMYESGASDMLVSGDGARGFFQVMPATFRLMGVATNIEAGVKYLSWLLRDYGREDDALAAYNGGPGRMKTGRLPIETVQYVVGVGIYKTLLTREESAIRTDAARLLLHRVETNEDWDAIAARTKIPVVELKLYNPYFASRPLRPGWLMAYPSVSEGAVLDSAPAGAGAAASSYVTRRGDNYLMLAFAFDVDLEQFRSDNALWRIQVPFEGMRMLVTPRDRTSISDPLALGGAGGAAIPAGAAGTLAGAIAGAANGAVADPSTLGPHARTSSPDGTIGVEQNPENATGAGGMGADGTGAGKTGTGGEATAVPPSPRVPYAAHLPSERFAAGAAPSTAAAPPAAPRARPRSPKTVVHRVQRGETLTRIASRYGVTVEAILGVNAMRQTRIVIGQRLRIPLG